LEHPGSQRRTARLSAAVRMVVFLPMKILWQLLELTQFAEET
jgi:hypothetical protein